LVPPSNPRTKPKACNFALQFARGEYLVISMPRPAGAGQLRKVVATFKSISANTACLQCRLKLLQRGRNRLPHVHARLFALVRPDAAGLERLNAPIPLGGTSNHFKLKVLRELHGWTLQRHEMRIWAFV